jgi:hypothetical protein
MARHLEIANYFPRTYLEGSARDTQYQGVDRSTLSLDEWKVTIETILREASSNEQGLLYFFPWCLLLLTVRILKDNRAGSADCHKNATLCCFYPVDASERAMPSGKAPETRTSQLSSRLPLKLDLGPNALVRDWCRPRYEKTWNARPGARYPVFYRHTEPLFLTGKNANGTQENLQDCYSISNSHTHASPPIPGCSPTPPEALSGLHSWGSLRESFGLTMLSTFCSKITQNELEHEIKSSPVLQKFLAKIIQRYCQLAAYWKWLES